MKKHWCNFFEYHRRGLSRDPAAPWADPNKTPLFREPIGNWDERYSVDVPATLVAQLQNRAGYEIFTGRENTKKRRKRADAQAAAELVRDRLSHQGTVVKLVKMLGFGGNGVASLFEVWPGGETAPSKKVVVKSLLKQGRSMNAEWSYNMVRATASLPWTDNRGPLMWLMLPLLTSKHLSRRSNGRGISSSRSIGEEK